MGVNDTKQGSQSFALNVGVCLAELHPASLFLIGQFREMRDKLGQAVDRCPYRYRPAIAAGINE
jgi:hypothetical protein